MHTIELSKVSKRFGTTQAVDDVSFEVGRGEIFGLLGPNGAGKTTTIRLMLDIFKPDSGTISVLGGTMSNDKKDRIGYMPEDRGLYQDWPLERCLVYLASLKGVPIKEATRRLDSYLVQFDLSAHKHKKIKELSKGMQQKAQIINTILHEPELIIIDEPFTALDPINTQMVKDVIRGLSDQGATILMSTHQMHHAEELCKRILIIDDGKTILYGDLQELRHQYAVNALLVETLDELPPLDGVVSVSRLNGANKLTLAAESTPQDILHALLEKNIVVEKFQVALPSLNDIFIRVVEERDG